MGRPPLRHGPPLPARTGGVGGRRSRGPGGSARCGAWLRSAHHRALRRLANRMVPAAYMGHMLTDYLAAWHQELHIWRELQCCRRDWSRSAVVGRRWWHRWAPLGAAVALVGFKRRGTSPSRTRGRGCPVVAEALRPGSLWCLPLGRVVGRRFARSLADLRARISGAGAGRRRHSLHAVCGRMVFLVHVCVCCACRVEDMGGLRRSPNTFSPVSSIRAE